MKLDVKNEIIGFARAFNDISALEDQEFCKVVVRLLYHCRSSLFNTSSCVILPYFITSYAKDDQRRPFVQATIYKAKQHLDTLFTHLFIWFLILGVTFLFFDFSALSTDYFSSIFFIYTFLIFVGSWFFIRCVHLIQLKLLERSLYRPQKPSYPIPARMTPLIEPVTKYARAECRIACKLFLENLPANVAPFNSVTNTLNGLNCDVVLYVFDPPFYVTTSCQHSYIAPYPIKHFNTPQDVDKFLQHLAKCVQRTS